MRQPKPDSRSFTDLIREIERGTIKIPEFQRGFVWPREKAARLLDSVLRGYPIGTFILWKTKDQLRAVREIGGIKLPETPHGDYAELVLDGQQRLTSLFAAWRGVSVRRESQTDDFREMYVDLDADPDLTNEDPLVLTVIEGDMASPSSDGRFVRLIDVREPKFELESRLSSKRRERLREYQSRLTTYQFSIVLLPDAPIDVATEVFTRINVSGQDLSIFEIMVAKTYEQASGFDLAEQFRALQKSIDDRVSFGELPSTATLQLASLMLVGECKKRDILRLDTAKFRAAWPRVVDAIEHAIDWIGEHFRIKAIRLLPYASLLVPIAYYFSRTTEKPTGAVADRLSELFWRVALTGRYTSATESKLAADAKKIDEIVAGREPEYDEGVDVSPEAIERYGYFRTSRSFIKAILCVLAFERPLSFATGDDVRIDNDWLKQANSKNYHHFFPRARLREWGVDERRANHIANITIVDDRLNKRGIRARKPSEYVRDYESKNRQFAKTMQTHFIDLDQMGVWNDDYDTFFRERCRALSAALRERVPQREIDTTGTHPMNDDDPDGPDLDSPDLD